MSNDKQHAITGALTGVASLAIINFFKQDQKKKTDPLYQFNWPDLVQDLFAGAVFGTLGGVLPDVVEPANSPNHRNFFHSASTALGVTTGITLLNKTQLGEKEKQLLLSLGLGYLSHLVLDGGTPKGLPLI